MVGFVNVKKSYDTSKLDEISKFSTLFLSFDIVNSTGYKTRDPLYALKVIKLVLERVDKLVSGNIEGIKLWTTRGDEIIYSFEILKKEEIYEVVDKAFSIMNQVVKEILNGQISIENSLYINNISLKSTAWIALVSGDIDDKILNKRYDVGMLENAKGSIEFQGPDIDAGFRVANTTTNRRMAISFELAVILAQKIDFSNRLYLICFEEKKGVWNGRKYPVIWYHNQEVSKFLGSKKEQGRLEKFEDSFFYDEEDYCSLTYKYKINEKKQKKQKIEDVLKKIKIDLNFSSKIEALEEAIPSLGDNSTRKYERRVRNEFHCVAICLTEEGAIVYKRNDGKFDFGCTKIDLSAESNLETALEKKYLKELGATIEVKKPFKTFYFQKNGKSVIGLRFLAQLKNIDQKLINSSKYKSTLTITKENFKEQTYIDQDDFEDIFAELLLGVDQNQWITT